jgi:MinD-like ATPase involved in chromosome partitioning or flagellar assembly
MNAHLGEARQHAIKSLSEILVSNSGIEKAVLVQDLFGLLRVILWLSAGGDEQTIRVRVSEALALCGRFWTGDIWVCSENTPRAEKLIYSDAWEEGLVVPDVDELRIDDRTRNRTGWLPRFRPSAWKARLGIRGMTLASRSNDEGPPTIVFYSFKGGVGRTTSLAAFAIQRARVGESVLVIDFDLDAPGAGTLLPGDDGEAALGVVDYLLEAPLGKVHLDDYVHRCKRTSLVGDAGGEVVVMPAGKVDESYLSKLSRLDLEIRGDEHPLEKLLLQARAELQPDWILIDSRAGLSAAAGVLLDGIAHLHVLFGTNSAQSQLGLKQVVRHLGEERIRRGLPQAKCVVVQAMVVDIVAVEKLALLQFKLWLDSTLRDHYLVKDEDDAGDEMWAVSDLDSRGSPGQVVAVPYRVRLAFFSSVDDVADDLVVGPYLDLGERLLGNFSLTVNDTESKGS